MDTVLQMVKSQLTLVTALGAGAIFAIDLLYPADVAVGLLYTGLIVLAIWAPSPAFVVRLALIASGLVVLRLLVLPVEAPLWTAAVNRALTLFVIWMTAGLAWLSIHETTDGETAGHTPSPAATRPSRRWGAPRAPASIPSASPESAGLSGAAFSPRHTLSRRGSHRP